MKISKLVIHNYRSIRECELDCREMLVLLGQNNNGKSNIFRALEFALSSSLKLDLSDLFAFAEDDDKKIWVEVTFYELTEPERTTWKKYVSSNGSIRIRKTAEVGEDGKINVSYNGYIEEPEQEWLKSKNATNFAARSTISTTLLEEFVPESGRILKSHVEEAQCKYIDAHRDSLTFEYKLEQGPLLGQKNVAAGVLPTFFLVPAIRDLSEESKVRGTAIFGKLMNSVVTKMTSADPKFRKLQKQLGKLISNLNAAPENTKRPQQLTDLESLLEQELSDWNVAVSLEITPPEISKIFELGTDIHLDDGLKTLAERKGHGLQRAVIFGLMKVWAKSMQQANSGDEVATGRKASDSLIFAIEEPELFLHPHAQRTLDTTLRELANKENTQVMVSSHSTHFVNLDHYRGIALTKKASAKVGTEIVQCAQDLFEGPNNSDRKRRFHMATWVNPDRGEMLFAQNVVFVEGETEKTLIPYLAKKLDLYSENVSIIDCGSKHNLPLYIEIAKAFKLSYTVIHDEDPMPEPIPSDWSRDKIKGKQNTFELNNKITTAVGDTGNVEIIQPNFEDCSGISKNQADIKGKALAAIDYFRRVSKHDIPTRLSELVRSIYYDSVDSG